MRYRRADVTGGTFFFTVNLAERATDLLTCHVDGLRTVVRQVRHEHPFEIAATFPASGWGGWMPHLGRGMQLKHYAIWREKL